MIWKRISGLSNITLTSCQTTLQYKDSEIHRKQQIVVFFIFERIITGHTRPRQDTENISLRDAVILPSARSFGLVSPKRLFYGMQND